MRAFLALLLLHLTAVAAVAAPYPARIDQFVNDYAQVLTPPTKQRITNKLSEWHQTSGIEVTLAIAQSRADYDPSASLESFALGMFNGWGIGRAAQNDGILVLVLVGDRNIRIALGSGFGPEWDAAAQTVIDKSFLPKFREGRISEGIEQGIDATIVQIAQPFSANLGPGAAEGTSKSAAQGKGVIVIILAFFALVIAIGERQRLTRLVLPFRKCPNCKKRTLSVQEEIVHEPFHGMRGKKRVRTSCSNCDWANEKEFYFSSDEGESRSGRSGGGGGSSSGGGASGKW